MVCCVEEKLFWSLEVKISWRREVVYLSEEVIFFVSLSYQSKEVCQQIQLYVNCEMSFFPSFLKIWLLLCRKEQEVGLLKLSSGYGECLILSFSGEDL